MLSGLAGFMVCDLCLFKAFGYIGARLAMLLLALSPLMAALGAMLIGQRMGPASWLGMFVTMAGVTWVAVERRPAGGPAYPPIACAACCCASWRRRDRAPASS